ncbi:YfcC family protein [Emergencia sp.]|uniref:YfcC family protein n=1 Tax=Emergencia sp. TaxID=1926557 RepID=UPI003AF0EFBF
MKDTSNAPAKLGEKKHKFSLPDTLVLLIFIVIVAGILTYIVPAGSFERIFDEGTGRDLVQAGTYATIDKTPVNLFAMFTAIPQGFIEAGSIIALVLIVGGSFGIINATGALNALLGSLMKKMNYKRSYIVALAIMALMAVMGIALGAAELLLPFIPLVATICFAMGYDSMTAIGIVLIGGGAGFAGTCMSPSTVAIPQAIAELPLYSGMWLRLIGFALFFCVGVLFVFRYMRKIKGNPQLSCMYETDKTSSYEINEDEIPEFNSQRKLIVLLFALGLISMIFCILKFSFEINQITAYYMLIAIVCGVAAGFSPDKMCKEFISGAKGMLYSAMIIGAARAISVVMTQGNILDTITYYASGIVEGMPTSVKAVGMFIVQDILNVVIPSGSGQAVVTMPIMVPIADLVGLTRQTAVLAFQYGDALTNLITPTSGYFMAALAMCNIPWSKWIKWFLPLYLLWVVIACIILIIATAANFGPF